MATSTHLAELVQRHRMLEDELSEALQHPSVDDFTLAELKRRKLQLKDEMARLAQIERDWALPIWVVAVLMMLWARTKAANISGVVHP